MLVMFLKHVFWFQFVCIEITPQWESNVYIPVLNTSESTLKLNKLLQKYLYSFSYEFSGFQTPHL